MGFHLQSAAFAPTLAQVRKGVSIRFSKMISYGNGCDVAGCDLLEVFHGRQKT